MGTHWWARDPIYKCCSQSCPLLPSLFCGGLFHFEVAHLGFGWHHLVGNGPILSTFRVYDSLTPQDLNYLWSWSFFWTSVFLRSHCDQRGDVSYHFLGYIFVSLRECPCGCVAMWYPPICRVPEEPVIMQHELFSSRSILWAWHDLAHAAEQYSAAE